MALTIAIVIVFVPLLYLFWIHPAKEETASCQKTAIEIAQYFGNAEIALLLIKGSDQRFGETGTYVFVEYDSLRDNLTDLPPGHRYYVAGRWTEKGANTPKSVEKRIDKIKSFLPGYVEQVIAYESDIKWVKAEKGITT